jgi:hypothetical protein
VKAVHFKTWRCQVEFAKYGNGRTALRLVDSDDGGTVAVATVNDPRTSLGEDEVLVKTWSENEGVLEALETAEVLKSTGRWVDFGHHGAKAAVCRLLEKPPAVRDPLGLSWVKFADTFPSTARLLAAIAEDVGTTPEALLQAVDLAAVPASSMFRAEQFARTLGAEDVEVLASGDEDEIGLAIERLSDYDGADDLFGILESIDKTI